MVYAKCVRIDRSKKKYLLRDHNGLEMWVKEDLLIIALRNGRIRITNLDDDLNFKVDLDAYSYLRADTTSDEYTKELYNKSLLMGAAPNISMDSLTDGKVVPFVESGEYDQLYISDYTSVFRDDIRANTVVFKGEQNLINRSKSKLTTIINCSRAIIMNRCVMSNLTKSIGIVLYANIIELDHEYIDENTVNEEFSILYKHKLQEDRLKKSWDGIIHIIVVHFDKRDVVYNKIYRNIRKIYNQLEKSKKSKLDEVKHLKTTTNLRVPPDKSTKYTKVINKNIIEYGVLLQFLISMYLSISVGEYRTKILKMINETIQIQLSFSREFNWNLEFRTEPFEIGRQALNFYNNIFKDYIKGDKLRVL